MPLDPQAEKFLRVWNALEQPQLDTLAPETARKLRLLNVALLPGCPALASVEDYWIPGPGGDLRLRVCTPFGDGPFGVCLYFHGGGWVLNSVDTHDDLVRRLAAESGCVFVSVDYRLAPEAPFPAATEDAYAGLLWVTRHARELQIDPRRIAVAGDSAGGNLAAVLCLMARDRGGPPIVQQCLLYPVTDCDLDRSSYRDYSAGYFLTTEQMHWFWGHYCSDPAQRQQPYASPLRADLRGLPPALVLTAEFDPLRDEGNAYAAALQAAGVTTVWRQLPGMIHAFLPRVETFDVAKETIREVGALLREVIGTPSPSVGR